MLLRLRLLRRIARQLPRYGKLTYCLYRDPRVPQRNKVVLTAALVAIYNPVIDFPLRFPVLGEMDVLALTVLAVRMFVDRAPKEVVAEHQERIALGTSTFDQDVRQGTQSVRDLARGWWRPPGRRPTRAAPGRRPTRAAL